MKKAVLFGALALCMACSGSQAWVSDSDIVVRPDGEGDPIEYATIEIATEASELPDAAQVCHVLSLGKEGSDDTYKENPFARAGFDGPSVRGNTNVLDQELSDDFLARIGPSAANRLDITPAQFRVRVPREGFTYAIRTPESTALAAIEIISNQTTVVQLYRLDVADVTVKEADGTTHSVPGTYTILSKESGEKVRCQGTSFPTGTGFDLPAGTYEIVTSFATRDGTRKTDVKTVTLGS